MPLTPWATHVLQWSGQRDATSQEQANQNVDKLCELNVIEQVKRLSESTLIEDAWDRGQDLTIHGWIYSLKDGLVRNLNMSVAGRDTIEPVYTNAVNELKKRYR